jgi:uncharacterized protein (DUF58 family)
LISDFQAVNYAQALKVAGKRHDLIAISVSDPRESILPKVGLVEVQDAESGAYTTIDTTDATTVAAYARRKAEQRAELKRLFAAANIDHIAVSTAEPYTSALIRFFKARERRLAH